MRSSETQFKCLSLLWMLPKKKSQISRGLVSCRDSEQHNVVAYRRLPCQITWAAERLQIVTRRRAIFRGSAQILRATNPCSFGSQFWSVNGGDSMGDFFDIASRQVCEHHHGHSIVGITNNM